MNPFTCETCEGHYDSDDDQCDSCGQCFECCMCDDEPDVCKNCNQERELVPDTPFCKDCYADMDDDDYDDYVWLPCGCHYTSCTCEGSGDKGEQPYSDEY